MAWDFETDPDFQKKLDWMDEFVREEIEPLDLVFRGPADPFDPARRGPAHAMAPLKKIVQQEGLWACHLGPELGGKGYGQVKLGLMNEILGRSRFAPTVFGCQAPDTGNAEILARFGSQEEDVIDLRDQEENDDDDEEEDDEEYEEYETFGQKAWRMTGLSSLFARDEEV